MKSPAGILQRSLDSFTARLVTRPGFELPERRYVHVGEVAYDDCETFVVHAINIGKSVAGGQSTETPISIASLFYLSVGITITRVVPGLDDMSDVPSAEALTEAALKSSEDAAALNDAFYSAFGDSDEIVGKCDNVIYGGITWNGPSGFQTATILNFSVQL